MFDLTPMEIVQVVGLVAVFLAVPVYVAVAYRAGRRRQSRIRSGFCANCGYDLRGSADRCPECGDQITRYP